MGVRGAPVTSTAPGWDEPNYPDTSRHVTPGNMQRHGAAPGKVCGASSGLEVAGRTGNDAWTDDRPKHAKRLGVAVWRSWRRRLIKQLLISWDMFLWENARLYISGGSG